MRILSDVEGEWPVGDFIDALRQARADRPEDFIRELERKRRDEKHTAILDAEMQPVLQKLLEGRLLISDADHLCNTIYIMDKEGTADDYRLKGEYVTPCNRLTEERKMALRSVKVAWARKKRAIEDAKRLDGNTDVAVFDYLLITNDPLKQLAFAKEVFRLYSKGAGRILRKGREYGNLGARAGKGGEAKSIRALIDRDVESVNYLKRLFYEFALEDTHHRPWYQLDDSFFSVSGAEGLEEVIRGGEANTIGEAVKICRDRACMRKGAEMISRELGEVNRNLSEISQSVGGIARGVEDIGRSLDGLRDQVVLQQRLTNEQLSLLTEGVERGNVIASMATRDIFNIQMQNWLGSNAVPLLC